MAANPERPGQAWDNHPMAHHAVADWSRNMLNVHNNQGAQAAGPQDEAAQDAVRARVKNVVAELQRAKQQGPLEASQVATVLGGLQPGDLTKENAAVMMTRIQNRPWSPSELPSPSFDIDGKAGPAFSALAHALRDRLCGGNVAPMPPAPVDAFQAAGPSQPTPPPAARPMSPRAPVSAGVQDAQLALYEMDPATRALIEEFERHDIEALDDRRLAETTQGTYDDLRAREEAEFRQTYAGYVTDGLMTQQEFDQQLSMLHGFAPRRN